MATTATSGAVPGGMTAEEIRATLLDRAANDMEFRSKLISDAHGTVESEFGNAIPEEFNLVVVEDRARTFHLVLPRTEELTEEELKAASGGAFYW